MAQAVETDGNGGRNARTTTFRGTSGDPLEPVKKSGFHRLETKPSRSFLGLVSHPRHAFRHQRNPHDNGTSGKSPSTRLVWVLAIDLRGLKPTATINSRYAAKDQEVGTLFQSTLLGTKPPAGRQTGCSALSQRIELPRGCLAVSGTAGLKSGCGRRCWHLPFRRRPAAWPKEREAARHVGARQTLAQRTRHLHQVRDTRHRGCRLGHSDPGSRGSLLHQRPSHGPGQVVNGAKRNGPTMS